jgi:hypothetical protein
MNDEMASTVTRLLEGAPLELESGVFSFYLSLAALTAFCLWIVFSDDHSIASRKRVLLAAGLTTFAVIIGFAGTPIVRSLAISDGKKILEFAQSNTLVAEPPAPDFFGNVREGSVILREKKIESLFGKPVETSSWKKEVNIEDARKLSDYLEKTKQGSITWNVSALPEVKQ